VAFFTTFEFLRTTGFMEFVLRPVFYINRKLNVSEIAIADCLEKLFTPHDLCEEKTHKRQMGARVQDLLEVVDINPTERVRTGGMLYKSEAM
jgi:hypothetical protein